MTTDARSAIRDFLAGHFPNLTIGEEDDIFARRIANSLFTMQLIMFIEKRFSLQIPNEELELDNFRTVAAMAKLVERIGHTQPGTDG